MKKLNVIKYLGVFILTLLLFTPFTFAQEKNIGACLANFCLDSRAGYMINEKNDAWIMPVLLDYGGMAIGAPVGYLVGYLSGGCCGLFIGLLTGKEEAGAVMWCMGASCGICIGTSIGCRGPLSTYAYLQSGVRAGLGACVLGWITPTGWVQFKEYKLRAREILRIIPIYGLVIHIQDALEAYRGVTWSEVVKRENLKR